MDWALAIHRNREQLLRILGVLFALVGESNALLPRRVYCAVLLVLLPAESAVRRLILIAAQGMSFSSSLLNVSNATMINVQLWAQLRKLPPNRERILSFCLIDPLKRFSAPAIFAEDRDGQDVGDVYDNADVLDSWQDGSDNGAPPRISVPGVFDPFFVVPMLLSPEDLINAQCLLRRLAAVKRALENLPDQACRLARWHARRAAARQKFPSQPGRLSPFRPGRPPGFRACAIHEIDSILRECHGLALDRLAEANTS